MEKSMKFYAYRANIAIEDLTLFNYQIKDDKEGRNKIFRSFFDQLRENKLNSSYYTREYILLYVDSKDDYVICNLARKSEISINKVENCKITQKKEEDYPYVTVIVDLKSQKILIENNSNVFSNYNTGRKTIENIIKSNIKEKNAIIKLNPISKENIFNEYLKDAEQIYSIKFKLATPNFLDGDTAAEDFLKDAHDKTSCDSVELTIKNSSGNLNLENTGIESFIKYSECGAGLWELSYKKDNARRRTIISSKDTGESVTINNIDLEEGLTIYQSQIIRDAFNKVEMIEKFKENI